MANNFKIAMHRNGGKLQLNLLGDFDGSSALELYNLLEENLSNAEYLFVNTEQLKKIYPFGRRVFSHNFFKLGDQRARIALIGENSDSITSATRSI